MVAAPHAARTVPATVQRSRHDGIVAVVDADASAHTVAVWHVDIGSGVPGMSRMSGALPPDPVPGSVGSE